MQMETFEHILSEATATAEDVTILMKAVNVVQNLINTKLLAAQRNLTPAPRGSLRRLASDIDRLGAVAEDVQVIIFEMMSATRTAVAPALEALLHGHREEPRAGPISEAFGQLLQVFEASEQALCRNEQQVANYVETVREVALRFDVAPEVNAAAGELMQRMKRNPSSA